MMRLRLALIGALVLLGPRLALAEEPAPANQAAAPVRAGKTTVTVIDENESVDDIVSRVRAERARQARPDDDTGRADPAAAAGARERALREKARGPRPKLRERIRERRSERKAKAPRLEKRIERLRSR